MNEFVALVGPGLSDFQCAIWTGRRESLINVDLAVGTTLLL